MDIENFSLSVIASIVAAVIIGSTITFKVINRNKVKVNKSFNNTTNNYFKDKSQQNNADQITINMNDKKED